MSNRPVVEPVVTEALGAHRKGDTTESHPAFGTISVSHPTGSPRTLFDSDIRHSDTVVLTIQRADRTRSMHRDWISGTGPRLIEVEMSQSQWAAMVSARSDTSCTIRATETERQVPGLDFASRLAMTADEVARAASEAVTGLQDLMAKAAEKPTKANLNSLRHAIDNLPSNLRFAAEKMTEHTEEVVTKARADIESAIDNRAQATGLPESGRPTFDLTGPAGHGGHETVRGEVES